MYGPHAKSRYVAGPKGKNKSKRTRSRGPTLGPGRKFEPVALQAARAMIYHLRPWLAPAMENTRNVVIPASRWPTCLGAHPTAAMDITGRMIWHEDFLKSLSAKELAAVMVHEVGHLLGQHPWRKGERIWRLWNTACDVVINGEIIASGDLKLPEAGTFGGRLGIPSLDDKAEGWTAELVYQAILDKIEENPDVEVTEEGIKVRSGIVLGIDKRGLLHKAIFVVPPPEPDEIANTTVVVKIEKDAVVYTLGAVKDAASGMWVSEKTSAAIATGAEIVAFPIVVGEFMGIPIKVDIPIKVGDIKSHDGVFVARTDSQGEPIELIGQVIEPEVTPGQAVLGNVENYKFTDIFGVYEGEGGGDGSGEIEVDGIPVPSGDFDPGNSGATGGPEHPASGEADEIEEERGEPPSDEVPDWPEIEREVEDLKEWYNKEKERQKREKSRGTEPGGMYRGIDPRTARINRETRAAIQKIIGRHGTLGPGQGIWSYARPSRRTVLSDDAEEVLMPAARAQKQKVVMVLDTSGSVDDSLLEAGVGQTMAVTAATGVPAIAVPCDAAVQGIIPATSVRRVIEGIRGGGGTDMVVGMEQARELNPDLIIVVTDMGTPWPIEPFDVPVLILTDEPEEHWGDVPEWATVAKIDTSR